MLFNKDIAETFFDKKVLLAYNCAPPTDNKYGWMPLPSEVYFSQQVRIEERVGLYGGRYWGSVGAPESHGLCTTGAFTYIYSPVPCGLVVGRYCSISSGLVFLDSHHKTNLLTTSALTFRPNNHLWKDLLELTGTKTDPDWHIYDHKAFPVIGNDVWIGRDVTLSMGINIGDGAVIAANSVVTKDVPPYAIMDGNPATLIRTRFPNEIALRLQEHKWWNKAPVFVAQIASLKIEDALRKLDDSGYCVESFNPSTIVISNAGVELS